MSSFPQGTTTIADDLSDGQHATPGGLLLLPDSDISDTDSALGESIASESTSLASSIRDYVYENGRRYHAYRAGGYVLPNDEDEQERLDMLHHIYRLILDGDFFRAPLSASTSSKRILDLGCGTGLWCIEVADDLPEAIVVGCDLSPIQPTWIPPNCTFYVDDIESDWGYNPEEHFDLIHGRALCGSIADWPRLFSQAYDNLRPGGYLEMQEYHCHVFSDDNTLFHVPFLADWVEQVNEAAEKHGKPLRIANRLKQFMQEAGFEDVREEVHKVPIGKWAKGKKNKHLGEFYQMQFLDAVEPFTLALFTRILGYSENEARAVVARVKNDLVNTEAHTYAPFHFIWGRKPAGF